MSLSPKEYVLKLFSKSAEQLQVPFVKTSPTNLQSWATKNEAPFIALVNSMPRSGELNDMRNEILSYDCVFIVCATNSKTPTIEEKIKLNNEVEKLADRFKWFVKRNEHVTLSNINGEELFRGASYRGVAYALDFTITLADSTNYCDDWCNDTTKEISCND